MKKYIIAGTSIIVLIIGTIILIRHIREKSQEQTPLEKWEQAMDSAAAYHTKVIIDSVNLIEAKKKLKGYEDIRDTLSKDMADDSFTMAVKRSILRARIKSDIRAKEIRDSIGRHGPSPGNN